MSYTTAAVHRTGGLDNARGFADDVTALLRRHDGMVAAAGVIELGQTEEVTGWTPALAAHYRTARPFAVVVGVALEARKTVAACRVCAKGLSAINATRGLMV